MNTQDLQEKRILSNYLRDRANFHNCKIVESRLDSVVKGLLRNESKYGLQLCPCRFYADIEKEKETKENVCPCLEFRNTLKCHCGLFG